MAQLAATQEITARIDWSLDYLLAQWGTLPAFAREEWPGWDHDERVSFFLDWPITNSHLRLLYEWQAAGQMTAAQAVRFADLLRLIARNRPVLATMKASLGS